MKSKLTPLVIALTIALSGCDSDSTTCSDNARPTPDKSLIQYINPFIGTGADGHTFPGAVYPGGLVQLSPDTEMEGWGSAAGYFDHGKLSDIPVPDYP